MNDAHSGTLRTNYETDRARLDNLPAMESEWQRLIHRLTKASQGIVYQEDDGREGTLAPLLANQALTVVAHIMRKQLSGYGETFSQAQGTIGETAYTKKLKTDIEGWIVRLEAFIKKSWKTGQRESPAATVATLLRNDLKRALPNGGETEQHDYYRMLRTVKSIQEHAPYYLEVYIR